MVLLTGVVIVSPCSLSRRKVADVLHCLFHLCCVASLFFHSGFLEFTEDVLLMTMGRIASALVVGNVPLVCILNLMHTVGYTLRVAQWRWWRFMASWTGC